MRTTKHIGAVFSLSCEFQLMARDSNLMGMAPHLRLYPFYVMSLVGVTFLAQACNQPFTPPQPSQFRACLNAFKYLIIFGVSLQTNLCIHKRNRPIRFNLF